MGDKLIYRKKEKIFCIGQNKTGTTSLEKALEAHNIPMGNQTQGEHLLSDYLNRDFNKIANFCKTAQAFQDVPFSLPYLFAYLDQKFKNSKFILTIRSNPEEWYQSITSFHSKLMGVTHGLPTSQNLENFDYHKKGWLNQYMSIYNTPSNDPYNKDLLLEFYNNYNVQVIEYFKNKDNLLIIDLKEENAYAKFTNFLNLKPVLESFPWANRT